MQALHRLVILQAKCTIRLQAVCLLYYHLIIVTTPELRIWVWTSLVNMRSIFVKFSYRMRSIVEQNM